MGFLEQLGKVLTASAEGYATAPSGYNMGTDWSAAKTGDSYQQLKAYESWVYAAATARAKGIGAAKLKLYKPDGTEVETHPFLDLWQKPCEAWHGYPWRVVVALHLLLSGNAYWYLGENGLRLPGAIWPLRPDLTEVVPGKKKEDGSTPFIDGYRYNGQIEFSKEQVIQIKLPNPYSNYYGMGVVEAARRAVDISRSIHDYALASFRNNAVPKAVYRIAKDANPDEVAAIQAMIESSYKGVANAGRSGVVTNALEDVKLLSMSPADMDYLEGANFTQKEIFALFQVHPSKAGMTDDINRANAETADYTFKADVVAPDLMLFEDAINSDLLPRYGSKVIARFDNVVPEDRDRERSEAEMAWNSGMAMLDEVRPKVGFDELGDARGQMFSVPFTQNIGAGEPEPRLRSVPAAKLQTARFAPQARAMGSQVAKHENQIKAAMENYFRSQRKTVMGRMRNELASWPVETARAGVNEGEERDRLYLLLLPLLLAAGAAGREYVRRLTGTDIPDLPTASARDRALLVAGIITDTTVRQLLAAIEGAADKAAALAAIEAVFDAALNARAPLIGRVEAASAVNSAALRAMQEAGFEYVQWQTVQDDRVEEFCEENESYGAIPIGAEFPSGDTEPPTNSHPGCRCVLVPATADDVGVTPVDVDLMAASHGR